MIRNNNIKFKMKHLIEMKDDQYAPNTKSKKLKLIT